MRRTNGDVGTCLVDSAGVDAGADAGADADVDAGAVNIAYGVAEADALLTWGARKQKHLRRRTRRRRRRRRRRHCSSPPAGHTNGGDVVDAEPEPAVAGAGSSGLDTHSWWDHAMSRALPTRTNR